MLIPDINGLVYALRPEATDHERYRRWLDDIYQSSEPIGVADSVAWGVVRISGNPQIWNEPTPIEESLRFVRQLRTRPPGFRLLPGPQHAVIVERLGTTPGMRPRDIPDIVLAALAIEFDALLLTNDLGFRRFPGLKWRRPLEQ